MSKFYAELKSSTNSFTDKQTTDLGKEARTGSLVDTEPIIIVCSNCGAKLATVKVTRPKAKIKSYIVAECCHCDDRSFKLEILGSFLIGGTDTTSIRDYPMETSSDSEYFIQDITVKTKKYDNKI
jgi:hypothetical protein